MASHGAILTVPYNEVSHPEEMGQLVKHLLYDCLGALSSKLNGN